VSIPSLALGDGDLLRLRLALLHVLNLRLSRRSERDNSSLSSRLSRRLGGVRERERERERDLDLDTERSRRLRGGERDLDSEALRLRFLGGGDRLLFEGDLRRRAW
jgi:hypothetical protein